MDHEEMEDYMKNHVVGYCPDSSKRIFATDLTGDRVSLEYRSGWIGVSYHNQTIKLTDVEGSRLDHAKTVATMYLTEEPAPRRLPRFVYKKIPLRESKDEILRRFKEAGAKPPPVDYSPLIALRRLLRLDA